MADATNPAYASRWVVEAEDDYARKALNQWAKDHPDDAGHTNLSVRLALSAKDEIKSARAEIEAMYRRHGMTN